ncbi:MAG: site-specific integrase [Dermatophilus congolensis]|nr:site-specific integrase [Dermatophilus congolensis]
MSIVKTPGGRWRVQVKNRGVVVADQTFDRRGDASRWETEQKRRLIVGDFVPPSAGKITVRDLSIEYMTHRKTAVATRTWESDQTQLDTHICPAMGDRAVGSITTGDVSQLLGNAAAKLAPATVAKVRVTLRGLFAYAVMTRRIRVSPVDGVPLPRPDDAEGERAGGNNSMNPFTLPELLAVVDSQRNRPRQHQGTKRYADVTLVLGLTGVRLGELRGLRVRDVVDVPYPALIVRRSLPQSGRTGRVIQRTRTKGGRSRMVPLSDLVRPVIREWMQGKELDDLLFTAPEGGYLLTSNWRRAVRWDETGCGRRPHDLRHTAATLWLLAGVDIKTVAAWLGHASAKLTLDTYMHWMGSDADRAALARVNEALGTPSRHASGTRATEKADSNSSTTNEKGS